MIELPQSSCLWQISMEIFVFWKNLNFQHQKKLFQIFKFWNYFWNFFSEYSDAIKSYFKKFGSIPNRIRKKSELNWIKFLDRKHKTNEKKNFCCWFLWEKLISFIPEDNFFQCDGSNPKKLMLTSRSSFSMLGFTNWWTINNKNMGTSGWHFCDYLNSDQSWSSFSIQFQICNIPVWWWGWNI
jgi:hypothetical protein